MDLNWLNGPYNLLVVSDGLVVLGSMLFDPLFFFPKKVKNQHHQGNLSSLFRLNKFE